jgi:hypothetical protein
MRRYRTQPLSALADALEQMTATQDKRDDIAFLLARIAHTSK